MWIMTNKGMLSMVQHREHPGVLLVRSRDRQTLEALLPDFEPIETVEADYRFRVLVPRAKMADVVMHLVAGIDYDNFKNSVTDQLLHDAYLEVWGAMYRYQALVGLANGERQFDPWYMPDDAYLIEESYPPGWPIGASPIADEDAEIGLPPVKKSNVMR